MSFLERQLLINKIEDLRGSKVICYLTSIRPNLAAQMSEDAVRIFFDHMLLLPERPLKKLDIFLCSNGGNGVVPWRLISLFREFAEHIGVILPFRAYSAATMLALGADEIVMHPFAEMGPIDPTVSNDFNPIDEMTRQKLGISVEDVKAYVSFVKDTVGIRHEDELIKALEIMAQKIHPLALGNVERFISQSRMITRKILLTHMREDRNKHEIDETIETLASKLYFHGHPINRKEAREELKLKVAESVDPVLEDTIWRLYLEYERELLNDKIFDPMADLFTAAKSLPPLQPGQPAFLPPGLSVTMDLKFAMIESDQLSSAFESERRIVVAGLSPQGDPLIRSEVLSQGWTNRSQTMSPTAAAPAASKQPKSKPPRGIRVRKTA